jgi:YjbE family integral membrane protein
MELLSAEFVYALLAIIVIDLVLAGDNALVIGLAARGLPRHQQRTVIFWGTVGAVAARTAMTIGIVWLLKIPGFLLVGGLTLIWIARKLVGPSAGHQEGEMAAAGTLAAAIRTIIVADAVMGVDNVIAIGGTARDSILLVILGLAISVPIIVWGSQIVLRLIDRFPAIILFGGGLLAWIGIAMMVDEPLLKDVLGRNGHLQALLTVACFSVALAPWFKATLPERFQPLVGLVPLLLLWLTGVEAAVAYLGGDVNYLTPDGVGDSLLHALRWSGWLPLAIGYLVIRQRRAERAAMRAATSAHPAEIRDARA